MRIGRLTSPLRCIPQYPQLQYRLITTLFSNSIEAIRGFNAFTLALLAAIFIAISKQLNSTVTSTITLLILFVTDFLFFNYNRLAHLETQVILWCGLSVFFQNKLFISHSTLQRAGWGFVVGSCFSALLLTKAHQGAVFGLAFGIATYCDNGEGSKSGFCAYPCKPISRASGRWLHDYYLYGNSIFFL